MYGSPYKVSACLGLSLLLCSSPSFAFISAPFAWYFDAHVGATKITNVDYPAGSSNSTSGVGGSLDVGYKFMPYFGTEIGLTRYANTNIEDQFGNRAGTDSRYSYFIAAKGIMPVYDTGFEFFGKLGVQRLKSSIKIRNNTAAANLGLVSSSHSKTGIYLALGGQYYLTPDAAVVLQWARAEGNDLTGNADLFSIGISYLFDNPNGLQYSERF